VLIRKETMARHIKRRKSFSRNQNKILTLAQAHGWVCYICGKQIPKKVWDLLSPDSPSIDHVLPRALEGTRASHNIRLAHRLCNVIKGDKTVEEARQILIERGIEVEDVPDFSLHLTGS